MRAILARFGLFGALLPAALMTLLWYGSGRAGASESPPNAIALNIGFTRYAFLHVNRNDAEASFKAFIQTVGRQRGYNMMTKVHVFDDAPAFEAAVKSGAIDLVIIDSWRYLAMDIHKLVTPHFITAHQGAHGKRYFLLTRQGSSVKTLEDLRGKSLTMIEVTNTNVGRPWLETLLMENRLGSPANFFGSVESVGKPSAAVLPVFFGNRDACLVDEPGYEIMKELNPQVGKGVQILKASEPLADALLCLRSSTWSSEPFKEDLVKILSELHKEPVGQQILTLFKVSQLLPFEEKQLETVKKLRADYERLHAQAIKSADIGSASKPPMEIGSLGKPALGGAASSRDPALSRLEAAGPTDGFSGGHQPKKPR